MSNRIVTAQGGADAIIAAKAAQEAKDAADVLSGTISVVSEGDDFIELVAITPAELIETTETVGGFEIEIIEIITPE